MDFLAEGLLKAFFLLFSLDPETFAAVQVTVIVSSLSVGATLVAGIPLGFILGYADFPGRRWLRLIVDTLLSFPTVVIGLLVYAFLTHNGPLGQFNLLFTISGMALGQILLGLPVVIALTATAIETQDSRLRLTLQTLGANKRQVAMTSLWEARYALMLAGVTAYGRIVSEVGISMMVGGNIKWHTRTITTAIALETGKGQFAMGIALGIVLLAIAFCVNLSVAHFKKRASL
ncbi:MAG: ABC transporter permease [Desulfovibrio sp.]|uniref:ABC transporter permease n=1 Tax=Desulfovibrio sp. 7SRBS1 TaxID=3378064 RepID=UPI003B40985E